MSNKFPPASGSTGNNHERSGNRGVLEISDFVRSLPGIRTLDVDQYEGRMCWDHHWCERSVCHAAEGFVFPHIGHRGASRAPRAPRAPGDPHTCRCSRTRGASRAPGDRQSSEMLEWHHRQHFIPARTPREKSRQSRPVPMGEKCRLDVGALVRSQGFWV